MKISLKSFLEWREQFKNDINWSIVEFSNSHLGPQIVACGECDFPVNFKQKNCTTVRSLNSLLFYKTVQMSVRTAQST